MIFDGAHVNYVIYVQGYMAAYLTVLCKNVGMHFLIPVCSERRLRIYGSQGENVQDGANLGMVRNMVWHPGPYTLVVFIVKAKVPAVAMVVDCYMYVTLCRGWLWWTYSHKVSGLLLSDWKDGIISLSLPNGVFGVADGYPVSWNVVIRYAAVVCIWDVRLNVAACICTMRTPFRISGVIPELECRSYIFDPAVV